MLEMLRDLIAHKAHANAALLAAIRQNEAATSDAELCELLHHILLANRFWVLSILGLPFVFEEESRFAGSLDALIQQYRHTHAQESAWLAAASEADLERMLESSLIPSGSCSVSQALMQVCMHSHGHRAQCARVVAAGLRCFRATGKRVPSHLQTRTRVDLGDGIATEHAGVDGS